MSSDRIDHAAEAGAMTDIRDEIARTLADWDDEGHAEAWLVEVYEGAADALMPLIRRVQEEARTEALGRIADTTREQLIEKAARAIYESGVTRSFADADWWEIEQAELEARAALAVFEEAHAPTDDERTPKAYRDGYHAGKQVGLSATAAMGEIATLRQERDYWRKRYEALEGEPTDATDFFVDAVESWFDEYNGTDPGVGGWYALEVNIDAARAALRAAAATQEGETR